MKSQSTMKCLMFCFLMTMVFVSLFSFTESKLREIKQKNPSNLNTDKVMANESNPVLNANKINTNNKVSGENSNKVESKDLKANTKHKVVSALNSDAKDKAQKTNINKATPKNANRAETKIAKVNQSDKTSTTGGTSGAAALANSLMPELMSEDEEKPSKPAPTNSEKPKHDNPPAQPTPSPTSSKHDKASSSKSHSTSTHKNHNHSNHTNTTHNNHTKYNNHTHKYHNNHTKYNNHTHTTHSNHTKYSNHTHKNHSKTSHSTKTNSTKTTKNSAPIKKSTPPTKTPTENKVAPAAPATPEIQYEPVEYVTQISPQGKAALLYNKDASYASIDAPGFETPTFVSNIVNTKPVGVTIPRPIVHVIGTDVDPGFWQNVELNRYGNKAIEAHQFITPASYHINEQPIRFLSIENPDDLDVFDEIDENSED